MSGMGYSQDLAAERLYAVAPMPSCHAVLGVEFFAGDLAGASALVVERALNGLGGYACLTGAHGLTVAQKDLELRTVFDHAWMNFPDGAPVAWRQLAGGALNARRVAGPDLMPLVIEAGQVVGLRHFLLGSTDEVLERLTARLLARAPQAQIAGTLSPPFRQLSDEEEAGVVATIHASGAHIVWVGLGAPKQELWMYHHAAALGPTLALGVGAAFDFISGNKPRAPRWMRNAGLEWLHRVGSEPRRLAPRYLRSNSRYIAYNLRELASRRSSR
jgi:N-acetylglucosaminyldiphosphoundecaprenol N-acetyl-beta-D-mannosaminyltransferase